MAPEKHAWLHIGQASFIECVFMSERNVRQWQVLNKGKPILNHKSALMGGGGGGGRVSRFSHCRKDSGEILDRNRRPGLIWKYCIDDLRGYREHR